MNTDTKINEFFGAKKFQRVVFKVEDIKFKVIDKFFPHVEDDYEKKLNKSLEIELANTEDEEKKRALIRTYHKRILDSRKENNNRRNRNYHMDKDSPMDFIKYLKSNKKIHERGLISNGIVYALFIPLLATGVLPQAITIPIVCLNTIGSVINFECINLQNYNIKRFEKNKATFEEIQKRREAKAIEQYGNVSSVVFRVIDEKKEIPDVSEVVDGLTTREQIEELRKMLVAYGNTPKDAKERQKVKSIGGMKNVNTN